MAENRRPDVTVIFVAQSSWGSATLFNPNMWSPRSKGIVQSCWAEFSVLHHCVDQITAMCKDREVLCRSHIETIQRQWAVAKFDLGRGTYFGEEPDLHLRIESFFSGIKSLLDLMVQLLSSERIVATGIHGFHKHGNIYGGVVLRALQNNARKDQKELAAKIQKILLVHKSKWIDGVIGGRDNLVHPKSGMGQLMFRLNFIEKDGNIACTEIWPPTVGSIPIDQYAQATFAHASDFASAFMGLVREAHPSPSSDANS